MATAPIDTRIPAKKNRNIPFGCEKMRHPEAEALIEFIAIVTIAAIITLLALSLISLNILEPWYAGTLDVPWGW